jgi:hypothetical protein
MRIPFGTGAYRQGESAEFNAQSMVNAFLEPAPTGSEVPYYVRFASGTQSVAAPGTGNVRGGGEHKGLLYVVVDSTAYQITAAGVATSIGSVAGTGRVLVTGDESHVNFVSDGDMYTWNYSTMTPVTDPDAPTAQWIANLDGYYITSSGGQFFVSSNRDITAWDALDFASAEKYPDDIVTGIVDHGELILFGASSFEVWYNSGDADFPLSKVPSGHGEVGCISVYGPAKLDNSVFFPGSDGVVYRLNGYAPQRISTHAIETAIARATDREFIGLAWTENGHKFYAINCDDFCLVFDVVTGEWHQRQSYGYDNWRVCFTAQMSGETFVGDSLSNKVAKLSGDSFTEFDGIIRSEGTCPPISGAGKPLIHHSLEIVMEGGTGTLSVTSPQLMLCWSDDNGKSWSSELWRTLGAQGDYGRRMIFNRLGKAKKPRIYKWAISDAARRTLIDAQLDAEACQQ